MPNEIKRLGLNTQINELKAASIYTYDLEFNNEHKYNSQIIFSSLRFVELFLSHINLPIPNHITCVIGIQEVYDEILCYLQVLFNTGSDITIELKSLLFLIPSQSRGYFIYIIK